MTIQKLLHGVDAFSTWIGKAFAWLIVALMLLVVRRGVQALHPEHAHRLGVRRQQHAVRHALHDVRRLHAGAGRPRARRLPLRQHEAAPQAALDLVLYVVFFLPGILALTWAGWIYFGDSLKMHETTFNATPLPIYPFKFMIPLAGAVVLLQGLSEMVRCVVCLKTGEWTPRLKDAEEIDVVEQQLAGSIYVDEDAKREAIAKAKTIDERAPAHGAITRG
jgi:TRAP-type mannitol/chloroaromatic compound transport system permease small subunit